MSVPAVKIFQGTPEGGPSTPQGVLQSLRSPRALYRPELAEHARKLALLGLLESDIADALNITVRTFEDWKAEHREFVQALARGRVQADGEMADSLYRRGIGYEHLATKIFMPAGAQEPVYAPYVEHYPPDTPAALAWLSRRQPALWRDRQEVNVTETVAHRIAQMSPEQRAADAIELVARARRRLAEYRQTIEHQGEPEPAPVSAPRPESQE